MQKFAGRYYTLNCGLLEIFFYRYKIGMFLAESTYICMGQCPDDQRWIQLMHACDGLA